MLSSFPCWMQLPSLHVRSALQSRQSDRLYTQLSSNLQLLASDTMQLLVLHHPQVAQTDSQSQMLQECAAAVCQAVIHL